MPTMCVVVGCPKTMSWNIHYLYTPIKGPPTTQSGRFGANKFERQPISTIQPRDPEQGRGSSLTLLNNSTLRDSPV